MPADRRRLQRFVADLADTDRHVHAAATQPATGAHDADTTPTPIGAVTITINPNPVPHSGAAITDAAGCVGVRYTWFYDQVLQETGGSTVTFTNRIDLFDDRETNNIGDLNIVVPANGSTTIRSRWCSSNRAAHTAQTRWTGTDAAGRVDHGARPQGHLEHSAVTHTTPPLSRRIPS